MVFTYIFHDQIINWSLKFTAIKYYRMWRRDTRKEIFSVCLSLCIT